MQTATENKLNSKIQSILLSTNEDNLSETSHSKSPNPHTKSPGQADQVTHSKSPSSPD
jgi:hypothetical protein